MSKTKKIAILAIIAMVLTLMPTALFAATADDTRLAGAGRVETALEIASAGWTTAGAVVLAPADQANLVDALAAAPLAGQENAPILLTFKDALDAGVKAKIAALGATKVYVIGAISDAVAADVDAINGVTVEKLAGADRWATADAINAKLMSPAGTFVVGYDAIADALSAASYAAKNKFAIVLAKADGTVDSAKLVGATKYIVGGTAKVKDITGVTRLSGADRFATNSDVASKLSYSYDRVYVANGMSLVDALAVAPLAAKYNAFVALAGASDVAAASVVNAKLSPLSKVIAVGGTNVVSDAVVGKVAFESTVPQIAAVTAKSYDDDTSDQYVEFTVNGKKADINALNADGWDIDFSAVSAKYGGSDKTTELFADVTTGLINNDLTAGTDYYVQVVLTKGADIVASELAKVQIKNLNLTATGISKYTLTNDNGNGTSDSDQFTMESTKLVVGETATFTKVTVTNGSASEDVVSGYSIKSSDAGVISKVSGVPSIYAEAPGTATVTITYGGATKTVSLTVVNDQREIDKVRVKKLSDNTVVTSVKFAAADGETYQVKAEALDQFGDPVTGGIKGVDSSNTDVVTVGLSSTTVTFTKAGVGTATANFFDAASGGSKIGSISVTTSGNTDVARKAFEMWKPATDGQATAVVSGTVKADFSTDTTIDVSDDAYVVYSLNHFNSEGLFLGASDNITYEVLESPTGVVSDTTADSGKKIVLTALKAGTATLKVTDTDTGKIYTVKITVVDEGYSIKSVSWKSINSPVYATNLNWKDALNYSATGNDPIINGITLNKAASQVIRLDEGDGTLYIDKDATGEFSSGDIDLGTLVLTTTGTFDNGASSYDLVDGIDVVSGDDGTALYKIWNPAGDKVLASKSVTVEL